MNMNLFAGWKDVFAFTFVQSSNGKFKRNTRIVAVVGIVIGMLISVIMALVEKNQADEKSPIQKVYIVNDTELDLSNTMSISDNKGKYPEVEFVYIDEELMDLVSKGEIGDKDLIVNVIKADEGYTVRLITPNDSQLSKSDANTLGFDFDGVMQIGKVISSGLSEDKLQIALSPTQINNILAGEEVKSIGEELMASLLPMVVMMLLYFEIMLQGIGMGNAISVEKTSKLMEMMLTMTRPYALILGKIMALTAKAILQIGVIFASFVAGFFAGDAVGRSIYPEYTNYLLDIMKAMKSTGATKAFSPISIVLFAVAIIISILFFFMLAATFGSFADKVEDVAAAVSIYQLVTIAGFFAAIMVPLKKIPWADTLLRIVPISSGFVLPTDILLGKITPIYGILYLLLLMACTIVVVLIAGKVYKNYIFYRGGRTKSKRPTEKL